MGIRVFSVECIFLRKGLLGTRDKTFPTKKTHINSYINKKPHLRQHLIKKDFIGKGFKFMSSKIKGL